MNQYSLGKLLGASEDLAVHVTTACHVLCNICKDKSKIFLRCELE